MRTNIDIDDGLMERVLAAGPYKTKKEAVEAGLRVLERQAAYREIVKWRGKLPWGWGDEERLDGKPNWSYSPPPAETLTAEAPKAAYGARSKPLTAAKVAKATKTATSKARVRR